MRGGPGDQRSAAPGSSTEAAELRGAHVPAPGALDGTLYLTSGPDCRVQALDLGRLEFGELGPATSCRLWASPDGMLAVARRRSDESRRELWLVRLGNPPALVRKLGLGDSVPVWSPDALEVAWCEGESTTVVLDLEAGTRRSVAGCFPRFLPDDRVVTRDGSGPEASVFVDGAELLDERDLLDGFFFHSRQAVVWAGGLHVLGSGAAPEGDLLVAVRTPGPTGQPTAVLERWQGEELREAFPIPASYGPAVSFFGFRVEVSPDGSEAALLFPERLTPVAERLAALVDLRTGAAEPAESSGSEGSSFGGLAWSPDGAWLALSTGREVRIFGADRTTPVFVLPIATRGLVWTR